MGHGANDPHNNHNSFASSQTCVIGTQTLSHPTASVKHLQSTTNKQAMSHPQKLQLHRFPEDSLTTHTSSSSITFTNPYHQTSSTKTCGSVSSMTVEITQVTNPSYSDPTILGSHFPGMKPGFPQQEKVQTADFSDPRARFVFQVSRPTVSQNPPNSTNNPHCTVNSLSLPYHPINKVSQEPTTMLSINPIPPKPGELLGSPSDPTKSSFESGTGKPKVTSAITMSQHSSGSGVTTQKVTQWLMDNYESHEASSLPRQTLYNQYCHFCAEVSVEHVNAASFGKLIRSLFPDLKTRRLGTRGNSKYHYYGIRIKPSSYLNQVQHAALNLDDGSNSSEETISSTKQDDKSKKKRKRVSPASSVRIKDEPIEISFEVHPQEKVQPLKKQRKSKKVETEEAVGISTGGELMFKPQVLPPQPAQQRPVQSRSPPTPSSVQSDDRKTDSRPLNIPPPSGRIGVDRPLIPPVIDEEIEHITEPGYPPPFYYDIYSHLRDYLPPVPPVPASTPPEITATKFLAMYQTHTQRILEIASRHCFQEIERLLRHFWQGIPPHFYGILASEEVIERIGEQDRHIYGVILNALFPNVLQPIPLEQSIACQTFAIDFGNWLAFDLEGLPEALRSKKLPLAQRFSSTLSRIATLNHQSVLCRTFLVNPDIINQMLIDWNKLDWNVISEQCGPVINAAYPILYTIKDEIKHKLTHRCGLEYYSHWIGDMISARFWEDQKRSNTVQAFENVQDFLGRWSIFWTVILNEFRTKMFPSFESYRSLSVFLQQYASYSVYNCFISSSQKAAGPKPFPFFADSTSFTQTSSSSNQPPSSDNVKVGSSANNYQQTGPPSAMPILDPPGSLELSSIEEAVEDFQPFEFSISGGSSFDSSFLNLSSVDSFSRKNSLATANNQAVSKSA